MADTPATHYDAIGGCTWGCGKPGQGNGICRRVVDPGRKYCPHHEAIALGRKQDEDKKYHAAQLKRRLDRGY